MPYGLKDIELAKLNEVFAANERIERVILYGSRAKGNYKPFSDVDITLEGDELTHTDLSRLSLAIDDLLLPYQFDISIFRTLKNEALIDHIRRMGITIYEKKSEWKEYKLGEIADVQTGPFGSQLHQSDYVAAGIPSIMPVNIGNRMEISTEKIVYVTENDAERLSRYRVQEGDIVYSRRGDVEKCAYIKKEENGWLCGTGCLRIRIDLSKADSKFVAYYLSTDEMKCWISNNAVGTTMPNLNSSILQQVPISLPSIDTQRRIAAILSSLDDKIDLLNRENATLEAMAETLFRQWFIEEAKEDWEEKPLSSIATFLNGLACQKYPPKNEIEKLPVLKIRELTNGIGADSDWATTDVGDEYIVHAGDVIFAWSASLMVKIWDGEDCILNQHLFKVTSDNYPKWFYFFWCKHHLNEFISIAQSHATTMGHIKRGDLDTAMVLVPSDDELQIMTVQMNSLLQKIENNSKQINTLTHTRDGLLPKLMFNEIIFNS